MGAKSIGVAGARSLFRISSIYSVTVSNDTNMSILLLTLGVVPFLMPLWTQITFRQIYAYEARQIQLDNAAITLGQLDRDLFRSLTTQAKTLRRWENFHHGIHLCARSLGAQAVECQRQDRMLEPMIESLARGLVFRGHFGWQANEAKLKKSLSSQVRVRRPSHAPLSRARCPVCGLETEISSDETRYSRETHLEWADSDILAVRVGEILEGSGFQDGKPWDYRLETE